MSGREIDDKLAEKIPSEDTGSNFTQSELEKSENSSSNLKNEKTELEKEAVSIPYVLEKHEETKPKFKDNKSRKYRSTDEKKSEPDKNKDFQNMLKKFKMSSSDKLAEYRKKEAFYPAPVRDRMKSEKARKRSKSVGYRKPWKNS